MELFILAVVVFGYLSMHKLEPEKQPVKIRVKKDK